MKLPLRKPPLPRKKKNDEFKHVYNAFSGIFAVERGYYATPNQHKKEKKG